MLQSKRTKNIKCTWFECPLWKRRVFFYEISFRYMLLRSISFPLSTYLDDEYQIGSVNICRTNKKIEFPMYKMHNILYYYIH